VRFLCLGDSLTAGTVGVGYIPFLEELLSGNEYVNLGVNGETIHGLRRRAERLKLHGDAALVWIGTNDVLMYPNWDDNAESAAADYEAILRLTGALAPKLLTGPPLLADPALAREYARSYSAASVLVRVQSANVRAVFVDIQAAFARFSGTQFTIDGAHLNNAGARLAAETIADSLRTGTPGNVGPAQTPAPLKQLWND